MKKKLMDLVKNLIIKANRDLTPRLFESTIESMEASRSFASRCQYNNYSMMYIIGEVVSKFGRTLDDSIAYDYMMLFNSVCDLTFEIKTDDNQVIYETSHNNLFMIKVANRYYLIMDPKSSTPFNSDWISIYENISLVGINSCVKYPAMLERLMENSRLDTDVQINPFMNIDVYLNDEFKEIGHV